MTLKLKGFETEVPGSVYGRDRIIENNGKSLAIREIVLLSRSTCPSQTDCLDYICRKVAEHLPAVKEDPPDKDEPKIAIDLESTIRHLPIELLEKIINKDGATMDSLKSSYTPDDREGPHHDLRIRYGIFMQSLLKNVKSALDRLEIKDITRQYEVMFVDEQISGTNQGEQWVLQLCGLPPLEEVLTLMKYGVIRGIGFALRVKHGYELGIAKNIVSNIYAALKNPGDIRQLRDESHLVLDSIVMQQLVALNNELVEVQEQGLVIDSLVESKKRRLPNGSNMLFKGDSGSA